MLSCCKRSSQYLAGGGSVVRSGSGGRLLFWLTNRVCRLDSFLNTVFTYEDVVSLRLSIFRRLSAMCLGSLKGSKAGKEAGCCTINSNSTFVCVGGESARNVWPLGKVLYGLVIASSTVTAGCNGESEFEDRYRLRNSKASASGNDCRCSITCWTLARLCRSFLFSRLTASLRDSPSSAS